VCDSLPLIEELSEDSDFPGHELAAAIASKCFYHLQEYNDALRCALVAGKYFDISVKNEYTDTLISKCIDEYTLLRKKQNSDPSAGIAIDPRMEVIVQQMFVRCYQDSCYEQAIGIALDTLRIDKVEEVCRTAIEASKVSILAYTFDLCQGSRNITLREFRLAVIGSTVLNYHYHYYCFIHVL
jgi:26S proteasome regulatory subunit N2